MSNSTLKHATIIGSGPNGLANHLPAGYRRKLERFRYGAVAFKIDWALNAPIPWKAKECGRAATVHLGCTLEEIAASEHDSTHGRHSEKPYVLVVQQSLFDSTRAPAGKHTAGHIATFRTIRHSI